MGVVITVEGTPVLSQTPTGPVQGLVTVNGHQAVAGEVLVQFADLQSASANHRILGEHVAAIENTPVARRGLRRFRSRTFDVDTMLAFFRGQPGVAFAEPNYILEKTALPNDPQFPSLWGLHNTGQLAFGLFGLPDADIDATEAWDVSTGSESQVVGIIDSGIDYTHPDLAENVWSAPAAFTVTIGGISITCAAGTHGFNAITRTCDPMDDDDHGTHVAGTIGARGNNGVGVTGVNWVTKMVAGKFLDASGRGTTAAAIDSIDFMIQAKAAFAATGGANIRVLNNSWGGGAFSTALRDMIQAANASNMLFVAAAGNSSLDNDAFPFYPASYDVANVVAVAATDSLDQRWIGSNYGATSVDLAAPGDKILSTVVGGDYRPLTGTSMATPHVAGAAALVLSSCALSTSELKNTLLSTVDHIASMTGVVSTGGRLNVDRALRTCGSPSIPGAPTALTATAGPAQVALTWQASSSATSYKVKRSTVAGGPYEVIASDITVTSHTDTALTPGQAYYYVVSAVNALGESPDSTEVSATPLSPADPVPARPANLDAVAGDAQARLTWNESPGAIRYRVKRSLAKSGPYDVVGRTRKAFFVDAPLVNGTKYFYVVSAINDAGESGDSNKAVVVPAPVPAPPEVVAVQGPLAGEIQLSWNAVDWATKYRVLRSTTSGGPYSGVRKVTSPSFTDTGLRSGRYYYVVVSLNATGESAPSIEVSASAR